MAGPRWTFYDPFTTETYEGKRLQKFAYKGLGTVSTSQGVVWPKR